MKVLNSLITPRDSRNALERRELIKSQRVILSKVGEARGEDKKKLILLNFQHYILIITM